MKDSFNYDLLNLEYTKENIKALLMMMDKLNELSFMGNMVACDIRLDLMDAYWDALYPQQQDMIKFILIDGNTYREYQELRGTNIATTSKIINEAIDDMFDYLGREAGKERIIDTTKVVSMEELRNARK